MGKIQLKNSFIFHLNIKYLVGLNMFENLKLQPEDKIMALMSLFKADERKEKIDLGVGVYKNNNGQTPIEFGSKSCYYSKRYTKNKKLSGLSGNLGL